MAYTLNGIDLGPSPVWADRHLRQRAKQSERRTRGGGVVFYRRTRRTGIPITLEKCHITEADLASLAALRDAGTVLSLNLAGDIYSVRFRSSEGSPIDHEPLLGFASDPPPDWLHRVTLKLLEI